MLIYVVRHGETDANAAGILQGWLDVPLNENGIALARSTGAGLKGVRFDGCFSSPLVRALRTAEEILSASGNDCPVQTDPRLREIRLGAWEGRKYRGEECEIDRAEMERFFSDPLRCAAPPGGETARDVCRRTQEFLSELTARDDGGTYLVTTHGAALRAMLNGLYADPSDFWHGHAPANCAVSIVEAAGGAVRLIADDMIVRAPENGPIRPL